MADDVTNHTAGAAPSTEAVGRTLPARQPDRAERARRTAYRRRFVVFYAVLGIIAGAAIGAAVALMAEGTPEPPPAWSAWEPSGSSERRAAQIGEHVSGPYRLLSGSQLAAVTYTGPPVVTEEGGASVQVRAIAIQPTTAVSEDEVETFDARKTVMFQLCGLGSSCSIAEGEPSVERGALLRREALELALYTFKHVGGDVESVLVQLPPRPDGQAATAVFIERSDVSRELSRPLSETLTATSVPAMGEIPAGELQAIERLTRPRLYQYGYVRAQDGSPVLVLAPALDS
jgi:hypothetical protein